MRILRAIILFIAVFAVSSVASAASAPVAVVEALHEKLLATMKEADQLGMDGRYRTLQPILEESFDFQRMIAAAAGSYWAQASDAERQRLTDAFTKLSITTYAARFNAWTGESFETLGERAGPRDSVFVDTRLNRPKDPAVPITYVMTETDGRWRIVDVLLDKSISELAVRRSEYSQVLRSGGPDKLAEVLDQKAAELRAP
ncbi:MAG: ABC transporter substrate-binding protein [Rhodospirillales bacterium]|nr:ABC transporter substrate-binding protein [Rhodospirillales bacterium]